MQRREGGRERMSPLRAGLVAGLLTLSTAASLAQQSSTLAADSAFARASRLSNEGNVDAARALVDSLLAHARDDSPSYVEALFWRATLAQTPDDARRDLLRIALEFPLSTHAEDALLRLAQIELARGDRATARKHLERLALEHAEGPSRAQGLYWMGRVLLQESAPREACASLTEAKSRAAPRDVELVNQINYYSRSCGSLQRSVDSARAESAARVDSLTRADSVSRVAIAGHPTTDGTTRLAWSAQVAAYADSLDADRLVRRLRSRGYDARVTPRKPYRVRIGRFANRDDATRLTQKLKAAKTTAIVVEAEKP